MAPIVVNQTDNSDKSEENETVDQMWFDHIKEEEEAFCYTCNSTAVGKDLAHHLFLGQLNCIHCTVKIATCDYLQEVYYSSTHKCKQNESGKHEFLKWQTSSTEYLSYFLRRELVIERFCRNLKGSPTVEEVLGMVRDYVCKLSAIENHDPWKNELQECWKYLERKNLGKQSCHSNKDSQNSNCLESEEEVSDNSNLLEEIRLSAPNEALNVSDNSADSSHEESVSSSGESQSKNNSEEDRRDLFKYRIQHVSKDSHLPKSVTISHQSSSEIPSTNKETTETAQVDENAGEILSDEQLEQDEPDDELLSAFTIGGLDQTIEYVTIQDACRGKADAGVNESLISENRETIEISSGKRKKVNESFGGPRKRKCRKYDTQNNDFQLPEGVIKNDNYLVIHFPVESCPEECPNCYCEFTPSMLTVNCSTFVSTIICEECNLTVYVFPE
ncbi:uncharacterized protein [Palaemon carinicauda]|uniref:uncharacterized protein n=1 Tax=Palaemon carinicauda TaxID=392227 RepID=UPI0035B5BE5D